MIGNINNFSLYSQDLESGTTTFVFSFDKPTGDIGGYYLYQSFDNVDFSSVKFLIDHDHFEEGDDASLYTEESSSIVFFTYSVPTGITDGRLLYLKLQGISISNELTSFSSTEQTYVAPTKPSNFTIVYDGYEAIAQWSALSTSTGKNTALLNYTVFRKRILSISGVSFDDETNICTHDDLEIGLAFWVVDTIKKSMWFGEVTTAGEFELTDTNKIVLASDASNGYTIFADNLQYYIEDPTSIVTIGTTAFTELNDSSFDLDIRYIYTVISNGSGSKSSEEAKFPIYTIDVENSYPYLRSPGNSDNDVLKQTEWKSLKAVLIDQNYYDKTQFAIPYFEHENYNLKGYLGVSNCKLDVYINNIHTFVTSTGDYGEFNIYYPFKKGTTLVKFQARDKNNIKFSRISAPYSIRTINIYSWFYTLGEQYAEIEDEIENIKTDVNISEARYSSFVDMYAPLINFYKQGDEDETIFRSLATEVFKSFEYATYDESLYIILNAFVNNLSALDHYEIYWNESLYQTQRTGYTFTASSTGLERSDFYYGISSHNSVDGSETDVTTLRVDRRWWPVAYSNVNILMWDFVPGADRYKIYRGTDSDNLYFLTSTGMNVFIDIGDRTENTSIAPRMYNYTSLDKPENLILYDRYGVNNLFLRLKKPSSLVIILYGTGSSSLTEYNLQRLLTLFEKLIPPEIIWKVIFANNDKVILYPEDREVDITEDPLVYALYDEHYYDGDEVYS